MIKRSDKLAIIFFATLLLIDKNNIVAKLKNSKKVYKK